MSSLAVANKQEFDARLADIKKALSKDSGFVINDNLQLVKRSGFWWRLLCLARPFYALIGRDSYSHVRIHQVVSSFLKLCQANQEVIFQNPKSFKQIRSDVFSPLMGKLRHAATWQKADFQTQFESLAPPKFIVEEEKIKVPDHLGISGQDSKALESALEKTIEVFRKYPKAEISCVKTGGKGARIREIVISFGQQVSRFSVPYTVNFLKKGGKYEDVLLFTKTILGIGASKKVRLVYRIFQKDKLAMKKVESEEKPLLESLKERACRGVVTPLFFHQKSSKEYAFEPCYQGDLEVLWREPALAIGNRLRLIEDVLEGLASLHKMPTREVKFWTQEKSSYTSLNHSLHFCGGSRSLEVLHRTYNVPMAHMDCKPGNLLVRKNEKNEWECAITDFNSSYPLSIEGSSGYQAPEKLQLLNTVKPLQVPTPVVQPLPFSDLHRNIMNLGLTVFDPIPWNPKLKEIYDQAMSAENTKVHQVASYKQQYGQAADVWAMGLVTLALARDGKMHTGIIPLEVIHNRVIYAQKTKIFGDRIDHAVKDLPQSEVDGELNTIAGKLAQEPRLQQVVNEVVSPMLRVKPEERISAQEALARLKKIMSLAS